MCVYIDGVYYKAIYICVYIYIYTNTNLNTTHVHTGSCPEPELARFINRLKIRYSIAPPSTKEGSSKAQLRLIWASFWDGGGIEGVPYKSMVITRRERFCYF